MIITQAVTDFGQINEGDVIVIEKKSGWKTIAVARKVIAKGSNREEIVINMKRNFYFITSKLLDGSSWVKNVLRIPGVEMTSITNTMKQFKD